MDNPVYANGLKIAISPMETQLVFRIDTPSYDENDQIVGVIRNDITDIRISPILAKTLRDMLDQNIQEYEKVFGEIKIGDYKS